MKYTGNKLKGRQEGLGEQTQESMFSPVYSLERERSGKVGGVEVTVGSKEILQQGLSEEMGVLWATRSIPWDDIFDPSMACPLLVQGAFKDGGGLLRRQAAEEAEGLLLTGPDPRVCAARLQHRIFQQPLPTTIVALGRCEDTG